MGKNDGFGHLLKKSFHELGMRTDGIYFTETDSTAVFSAVMNVHGGLELGVADMNCHLNLPIRHLEDNKEDISTAKCVLVDTNVSCEVILKTLELAKEVKWTILEPISAEKSQKVIFKNIIPLLTILKPNEDQFEDLYNILVNEYSIEQSRLKLKELSPDDEFVYKADIIFEVADKLSKQYD